MAHGQVQRSNLFPTVGKRFAASKRNLEAEKRQFQTRPTDENGASLGKAIDRYYSSVDAAQNLSHNVAHPPKTTWPSFSNLNDDYLSYLARPDMPPPPNPKAAYEARLDFISRAYNASIYGASRLPPGSRMPPLSREAAISLRDSGKAAKANNDEKMMMAMRAFGLDTTNRIGTRPSWMGAAP